MIEEYKEDYLEDILQIWLDASILAHDFMPANYWISKLGDMKNIYIPASETYVYLDESLKVLGFISLIENFIAAIFVSPTQQGKGIGTELMSYIKTTHQSLELRVYKANDKSVQFYKKQGFIVIEEKIEDHTVHKELVMRYI